MTVWTAERELHVANTGAPLDVLGVQALAALRASDKEAPRGAEAATETVGRFGVGFTSVLTISDEIEIRSTSGSVVFSAERSRAEVQARGIAAQVDPPTLRLPFTSHSLPKTGTDTEVVLHLRDGVDPNALLAAIIAEAPDLLLELPALGVIRIGDTELRRTQKRRPHGVIAVSIGAHTWWQFATERARWLLPVEDGQPCTAGSDVLRAPTRSDEELSLPALLVADIAMQPDRRRLLPGADVPRLAKGYAKFARALPPELRLLLVPQARFARSEADRLLRDALIDELRNRTWLPVVGNSGGVRPPAAAVLPGVTPELAALLAEAVPGLVIPELSEHRHAAALAELGVRLLGLAEATEALRSIDRDPPWWRRLYTALEPLLVDRLAAEELGGLPVPLADGRVVTGPRTTLIGEFTGFSRPLPLHWARLVHPEAEHPLLGRLGARTAHALDLLSDPALRAELESDAPEPDVSDHRDADLAEAVLTLAADVADPQQLPGWLGLLPLPDAHGELRPVDELLLPGAPLTDVLIDSAPFGTIDQAIVDRYGIEVLRAVGAVWTFSLLRETDPTGPDHDLDDEADWWDSLSDDPAEIAAVRDLDLVDDDGWPSALELLATDPRTRPLLADRTGYTAWWLRRHARVHGEPLGLLRALDAAAFAEVLDPLEHPHAEAFTAALADGDHLDGDLVAVLVQRLADPERHPTPATIADTYRRLAEAVAGGVVDPADIPLPQHVRAVSGSLILPEEALVLDRPWLAMAVPPDRLVVGSIERAHDLASLLDLPLASDAVQAVVTSSGRATTWASDPLGVLIRTAIAPTAELPSSGPLVVHTALEVKLTGAVSATVRVPWWVTEDGTTHLQQP